MLKNITAIFISLTLCACASTSERLLNNATNNITKISSQPDSDYTQNFYEVAKGFNTQAIPYKTKHGEAHIFKTEYSTDWFMRDNPFFVQASKAFEASCSGSIAPLRLFDDKKLTNKGFDALKYVSQEQIDLMGESNSLDYSLNAYMKPFITESDLNTKNIVIDFPQSRIDAASKVCIVNGKSAGAIIYFSSYQGRNEKGHTSPVHGTHALNAIYLPPQTTNTFTQFAFDTRWNKFKTQQAYKERRNKAKEERKVRERKAADKRQKELQAFNNKQAAYWESRSKLTISVGDKVCNLDNQMGYVEAINNQNVKVWFKGVVIEQPRNHFYGNANQLPGKQFTYRKIDLLTWVKRKDIAPCNFTSDI